MITSSQIRAARAMVKWSAQKLADEAGVGISTVQRMEKSDGVPNGSTRNLNLIETTLEKAGVEFIPENGGGAGVRFRKD